MDELGLPVQRPSKVPAYLYVAGSIVCAIVAGGTWIYIALYESDTHLNFPHRPVQVAAGVIGLLPLLGARKLDSFNKVYGDLAGTVMGIAVIASVISGFAMLLVGILPHSACSPDCGGGGG